jgi:hypothetical protein
MNNPIKKYILEMNGIELCQTIGGIINQPDTIISENKARRTGHFIDFDMTPHPSNGTRR